MKTNRRILFAKLTVLTLQLMTASLATAVSLSGNATTTKVGNGDDGADLEALTTIKSGPIWDSRKKAVELLERLNVTGVVGLGILIPELKATEMLMVESDARPTVERAGSIEISEDSRQVYARTFAEPYAATRFFPAAAKLSTEQLVALHIHEALHRALPAEIREDENKVAHITLALTSPGASFDRVSSVANLYLKPAALPNVDQRIALGTGTSKAEQEVVLPPKSKSNFVYSADMFGWGGTDSGSGLFSLGIEGSGSLGGYRKVGSTAIEPYFRGRLKAFNEAGLVGALGPVSLEFQALMKSGDTAKFGPFIRFTSSSLSGSINNIGAARDRDIVSLGGVYRAENSRSYAETELIYSLPSNANYSYDETQYVNDYALDVRREVEAKYKSVVSLKARSGFKRGRFLFGGTGEFHASRGADFRSETANFSSSGTRLIVAGPELGAILGKVRIKAYAKAVLTGTGDLDALADIMDRGAGNGAYGASLDYTF